MAHASRASVSVLRRTTLRPSERALLEALEAHDTSAASLALLEARGVPMTAAEVAGTIGLPEDRVARALSQSHPVARKAGGQTVYFDAVRFEALVAGVAAALAAFHGVEPTATGIATGALRDAVDPRLSPQAFEPVLAEAVARGFAVVDGGEVRDPNAASSALAAAAAAERSLEALLDAQALAPATVTDLAREAGVEPGVARKALGALERRGRIVRVAPDLYFSAEAIAAARSVVEKLIRTGGPMLASDARDALGTSRKYVVPLLEWFDAQGLTRREGDARVLRKP